MPYPKNGTELLKLFEDYLGSGYFDPVVLKDVQAGFSIQRNYPSDIRFKPALNSLGEDDSVACIWVVYQKEKEVSKNSLIPIRFRVALMSRYRSRHMFDDDDYDPEKPTDASLALSQKSSQPLDLAMKDGCFFDLHTGGIVNNKGSTVNGTDVLDEIYSEHCNSVHPLKGLPVRSRVATHNFSRGLLDRAITSCKWCLKNLFGRTLNERNDRLSYLHGYRGQDFGKLPEDCIEWLGYRVPLRVIGLLVLVGAIFMMASLPIEPDTYTYLLLNNETLLLVHGLAALLVCDIVLPHALFAMVNFLIYCRRRYFGWLLQQS